MDLTSVASDINEVGFDDAIDIGEGRTTEDEAKLVCENDLKDWLEATNIMQL